MPINGAGLVSKVSADVAIPNDVVESAKWNDQNDDFVDSLNAMVQLSGVKPFTGDQPFGNHKATGVGDGTAAQDAATLKQVQTGVASHATAVAGTVDAIQLTFSPANTTLTTYERIRWKSAGANTSTTPTISKDAGSTNKTVKKGASAAIVVGDLGVSGTEHEAEYNGTDWILLNPAFNSALYALLASANVFTADQTIRSSDASATVGPLFSLDRNSASPAAGDTIGDILFTGRNSAAATKSYAQAYAKIVDETASSEDGSFSIFTQVAGVGTDQLIASDGVVLGAATGGAKGTGTANATEYYKNGVATTRQLIATLTTTSGTTQSVTSIPAYRELYIEIAGVSFTGNVTMTLAVSDDNGSNYGTARPIAVATGSGASAQHGTIRISNIQGSDMFTVAQSVTANGVTDTATVTSVVLAESGGSPAVINAIRFAGGTFDAGTIRVYGLL